MTQGPDTGWDGSTPPADVPPSFVPLADVEAEVAPPLLDALGRARIPFYAQTVYAGTPEGGSKQRLYVPFNDRLDARTIIASAARGLPGAPAVSQPDPLFDADADKEFEALVADWPVDTHKAIRAAERDLSKEDANWRANIDPTPPGEIEEHYVPPAPPPLPRLAAYTVWALVIICISILLLGLGGRIGFANDLTFLLGVGGILIGAGMLIMRLRGSPRDEDDDGAVL